MLPEPAEEARMLKVAIAPDAPVVAEGTAAMLSRAAPDIDVICLIDMSNDPGPVDIFLYDPNKHAVADLAHVRRLSPHALVVAFCWSARADIVDEARRDGAAGFLSKELDADEAVAALRALRAGHRDSFVVLPGARSPTSSVAKRPHGLTERELEVLRLITHGYSNDEIARRLFLSINSVKSYIRTGYRKIGATRRTQAVLWGVEQGLAPAGETRA
jgi:DNA-binding NarL/FixJ family response regulator